MPALNSISLDSSVEKPYQNIKLCYWKPLKPYGNVLDTSLRHTLRNPLEKLFCINFYCTCMLTPSLLLQCFTPTDLYNFHGSSPSKALNSTEFNKISPLIVYCLLPTPERARVPRHCAVPKNYSELYNSIARNFSKQGEQSITHKALNEILEEINKTIGEYLHDKKVSNLPYIAELSCRPKLHSTVFLCGRRMFAILMCLERSLTNKSTLKRRTRLTWHDRSRRQFYQSN